MFQLRVLTGARAGTEYLARHLPISIGRQASNHLRLEEAGVWDRHLEIRLTDDHTFKLTAHEEALVLVNDERVQTANLTNGDRISLGSLQLEFGLSATQQRSVRFLESLVWSSIALLTLGQIVLIYLLPG